MALAIVPTTAINPSRPSSTRLARRTTQPWLISWLNQGKYLAEHVRREFDACLKCGRLECGCLRVRCEKRSVSACAGISHRHAAMTWAERLKRVCV